jgi:CBS domain-containing protein
MTVQSILARKGSDVATIAPTAKVSDAIKMLCERKIGALLITGAAGRITGIVSERDIVRTFGTHGAAALDMPLTEVMTRKVVTCEPTDKMPEIMELMTTGKFRHLPVLENDQLVGIISIGDVVKMRLAQLEHEQDALRDYIQTA